MALTEEQKERIQRNRERALEIQRQRRLQQENENKKQVRERVHSDIALTDSPDIALTVSPMANKKGGEDRKNNGRHEPNHDSSETNPKRQKISNENNSKENNKNNNQKDKDDGEENVILEEFEMGASDLVTKQEAKKMYCLPEGTLAVCSFVEKPNPHNKSWTPMKLYSRKELRQRARKRYGGLQGLIDERKKREEKQFRKDMQSTKNIFR